MLGNECSMQFRNLVTALNKRPKAMAMIKGSDKYPAIKGSAKFFEVPEGVLVAVDVCGLPSNVDRCDNPIFALHIRSRPTTPPQFARRYWNWAVLQRLFPEWNTGLQEKSALHLTGLLSTAPVNGGNLPPCCMTARW